MSEPMSPEQLKNWMPSDSEMPESEHFSEDRVRAQRLLKKWGCVELQDKLNGMPTYAKVRTVRFIYTLLAEIDRLRLEIERLQGLIPQYSTWAESMASVQQLIADAKLGAAVRKRIVHIQVKQQEGYKEDELRLMDWHRIEVDVLRRLGAPMLITPEAALGIEEEK